MEIIPTYHWTLCLRQMAFLGLVSSGIVETVGLEFWMFKSTHIQIDYGFNGGKSTWVLYCLT